MPSSGCIGIVVTQTAGGCVMVDHRVHRAGRYPEKQPWAAELLEVAQVVLPVGLRDYSDIVAVALEDAANDGSTESRMIYIGIA